MMRAMLVLLIVAGSFHVSSSYRKDLKSDAAGRLSMSMKNRRGGESLSVFGQGSVVEVVGNRSTKQVVDNATLHAEATEAPPGFTKQYADYLEPAAGDDDRDLENYTLEVYGILRKPGSIEGDWQRESGTVDQDKLIQVGGSWFVSQTVKKLGLAPPGTFETKLERLQISTGRDKDDEKKTGYVITMLDGSINPYHLSSWKTEKKTPVGAYPLKWTPVTSTQLSFLFNGKIQVTFKLISDAKLSLSLSHAAANDLGYIEYSRV